MKVKCPECGAEIEKLNRFTPWERKSEVSLSGVCDGLDEFERDIYCLEGSEEDFECPVCDAVLCNDEDEALKILKGEVESGVPCKEEDAIGGASEGEAVRGEERDHADIAGSTT